MEVCVQCCCSPESKVLRPSMFPVSKYSVGLPSQYFAVPSKAEMINSAVAALWTVTCD